MVESVVFHRLITNFEEKALKVYDSEKRRRARPYQDEAWCSSSGITYEEKLSPEEKTFS